MSNSILSSILILFLPLAIVLSNLRIFINPWFPQYEYSRAGFPPDPQGMDSQMRLKLANRAIKYLVNSSDISYLTQDRDINGNTLYTERELRHMEDVKIVVGRALGLWRLSVFMVIGAFVWLGLKPNTDIIIKKSLSYGAGIIVVSVICLLAYILINFDSFFTTFHQMFFESGTWTFSYTDMLIRLFPPKFWSDVATYIAGASLFEGVLLWWAARFT
ncbi:MAG TPA: TIGR01906 family membrane protein [Chloroflexi bacterium]|nr:TIGR01906 family membrane protein [Chloroflexota bacterium]|tara:strand:+ start:375 stop:1025 length:651 start_codon:yes stop_codon:yes gene_type:complete